MFLDFDRDFDLNERQHVEFDLNNKRYAVKTTVYLDDFYDSLREARDHVVSNNFFAKTGSGKLVARISEDEFFRNPTLQKMQALEMQGEKHQAKKILKSYLNDEGSKQKFANM